MVEVTKKLTMADRPTMADMPYHYGWKMRMYPSSKQKQMIKAGINASRFTYNECVAMNQYAYNCKLVADWSRLPFLTYKSIDGFWRLWRNRGKFRKKTICNWNELDLYVPTLMKMVIIPEFGPAYYKSLVAYGSKIRERYEFLQSELINSYTINMATRSYSAAWKLWRKAHKGKKGTPRFKRKDWSGAGNMQLCNTYSAKKPVDMYSGGARVLDNKHINLPLFGQTKVSHLKEFLDNHDGTKIRIGTVTISQDNLGKYWVAFQLGSVEPFKKPSDTTWKELGIDLNVDNFLTSSNSEVVSNPKFYRNQERYLKQAKRKLSRRQLRAKKENRSLRDSKNYQKQRQVVARKLKRIANQRNHFLHELSTALIKNHDLVVAEELRSSNMLKNHALAKAISDVGWRTFLQMLSYKADLYGVKFLTVDPKNTTQTCSDCWYVMGSDERSERLSLSQREWTCPNCDTYHIRDVNAATNILKKGKLALAE